MVIQSETFQKESRFTDAEIGCKERAQFSAHRLVLARFSPVFKSLHNEVDTKEKDLLYIKLEGFSEKIVDVFLDLVYTGILMFLVSGKNFNFQVNISRRGPNL